ncbi:MAG: twin-arginine translocation signal domain-containing protein [Bacteroidales bacterium]|nr:twin-arginine translocation signal domain-containing protein [Bacteroidales bacterium]
MENRRGFLKKTLAAAGLLAVSKLGVSAETLPETFDNQELNADEKQFLKRFQTWVVDCETLVVAEKLESRWLKDNQQIMNIADQAKDWMPEAQKHMNNREFRKQFLVISDRLTNLIEDNSVSNFSKV